MNGRSYPVIAAVTAALALAGAIATSARGQTEGFVGITAGEEDTCALTSGGDVMCWGRNLFGQLGIGSVDDLSHATPTLVTGLESGVQSVSAGWHHVCAVTAEGGAKCWGQNTYGQLGDGSTTDRSAPTDVVGLTSGIVALATDELHTCALTSNGGVKCWGDNREGGLGNDSTINSSTPVDVVELSSGATAIAVGQTHSCALISDGTVKCWGGNFTGELGHPPTTRDTMSLHPVDVPGLADVAAIATGSSHTCALTSAGGAKCWGNDFEGQLGDGRTETTSSSPVDVIGLTSGVAEIAARDAQTCAVTASGVKCWGFNVAGQLGNGTTTDSAVPMDVVDLFGGVTSIAAGVGHTCALLGPDAAKCWGSNGRGELGDGSTTRSSTPVEVLFGASSASPSPGAIATPTATATPTTTVAPTATLTTGSTPSPRATGAPVTSDVDGPVGDWYLGPTPVSISFAGGQYSARNTAAIYISGAGCDVPIDSVLATFSGSSGSYAGQVRVWSTGTCVIDSLAVTLRLEGNRLVATEPSGRQLIFTRRQVVVPFRNSVPTIAQITLDPIILLESLAIAGGFVLLIPFPGALFDNTLEANYAEVMGWGTALRRRLTALFRRGRPKAPLGEPAKADPTDGWKTLPRLAFALLLGVLLGCLLDPTFGLSVTSAATFVGVLGGVVVTMAVFSLPLLRAYGANMRVAAVEERRGWEPYIRALPAALAVAVGCVLISRLTNFQPGYLYGLLIGVTAAHELSDTQSARTGATAVVVMLLVAAVSWLAISLMDGLGSDIKSNLLVVVIQTVLATIMVAGVQGSLFSLLPMRYFAGAKVLKWNRWIWGALLVIAGMAFWHVLVNPTSGYLADSSRTPLVTIVALLTFFGLGSIAFWAYFRFRRPPAVARPNG